MTIVRVQFPTTLLAIFSPSAVWWHRPLLATLRGLGEVTSCPFLSVGTHRLVPLLTAVGSPWLQGGAGPGLTGRRRHRISPAVAGSQRAATGSGGRMACQPFGMSICGMPRRSVVSGTGPWCWRRPGLGRLRRLHVLFGISRSLVTRRAVITGTRSPGRRVASTETTMFSLGGDFARESQGGQTDERSTAQRMTSHVHGCSSNILRGWCYKEWCRVGDCGAFPHGNAGRVCLTGQARQRFFAFSVTYPLG